MIYLGIIALLFAASMLAGRRYGLLGLALAAGSILSSLWSYDAQLVVSTISFIHNGPVTTAVTLSLLVLLPAIVLMFHGFKHKNIASRIVGSVVFALLGAAFLVDPLGPVLPSQVVGFDVYGLMVRYKSVIISVGLVLAVVDLFFIKPTVTVEKKGKK